jgi:hypothetical protein
MAQLQRAKALGHPWCRGLRAKEKAQEISNKDGLFLPIFERILSKSLGFLLPERAKCNTGEHFKAPWNYSGPAN